jgi:protein-S-isoprenylcysteine O-methyltransferase Ste14
VKLNAKAWLSLFVLVAAMGLMLFPPAGTFRYWQAWLYLSVFACASSLTTLYLMRRDPATPLALGSYWGLLAFAAMLPFLIWRLLDEEQLLDKDLPGYREYRQRVRHRLVPFVW